MFFWFGSSCARRAPRALPILVLLIAVAKIGPISALTYEPVSDRRLFGEAPLVVEATVLEAEPARDGRLVTFYSVRVDEVLKADGVVVAGDELRMPVVGVANDEVVYWVPGAPHFERGQRTILALGREHAGERTLHQFVQGAFVRAAGSSGALALRFIREARAVGLEPEREGGVRRAREFDELKDWIVERGWERPLATAAAYWRELPPGVPVGVSSDYRLFSSNGCGAAGGHPIRWFHFDRSRSVVLKAAASGQFGVGSAGVDFERRMIEDAMAGWSSDPRSVVALRYGGTSGLADGEIVWNDPHDEIPGRWPEAKTLALGGSSYRCSPEEFRNGEGRSGRAHMSISGFVVINDGAEGFLAANEGRAGTAVLMHEIGHVLGIGHSGSPGAIMRSSLTRDATARLGEDDRSAVAFLYPDASAGELPPQGGEQPEDEQPGTGSGNGGEPEGGPADPGVLGFSVASVEGVEGETVTLDVLREGGSDGALACGLWVVEEEAELGSDFAISTTTFSWEDGDSAARRLEIELEVDARAEGRERARFLLDPQCGAALGTAELELVIDDPGPAAGETPEAEEDPGAQEDPQDEEEPGGDSEPQGEDGPEVEEEPAIFPVTGVTVVARGSRARRPAVAIASGGEVAYAWQDDDGAGSGIEAVVIGGDENGLRSGLQVADGAAHADWPRLVFTQGGDLLIAWVEERDARSIHVRRRHAEGPLEASLATGGCDPGALEVDAARTGDVLLSWACGRTVLVERLDGSLESGASIEVTKDGAEPDSAIAASGESVVVWREGDAIRFLRFDDRGRAEGSAAIVPGSRRGVAPRVAMSASGAFTVVWSRELTGGHEIFARRFAASGRPLGDEIRLSAGVLDLLGRVELACNAVGDCAAAWIEGGPEGGVFVKLWNADGKSLGAATRVVENVETQPTELALDLGDDDHLVLAYAVPAQGGAEEIRTLVGLPEIRGGPCDPERSLCLGEGRFRLSASWQDPEGQRGVGSGVPLTGETGHFWFFDPANVEIVVKTLDACAFADGLWVFAGGLTNVEVQLIVDDVWSGDTRTYWNAAGERFRPIQDAQAFAACGASAPHVATGARRLARAGLEADGTACGGVEGDLCLRDGRFRVHAEWRTATGDRGFGRGVPLSGDTGYLWFFDRDNVEVVVKVLDACSFSAPGARRFWVFAGGLTNQEVELTVTDTVTGSAVRYANPLGTAFEPVQDSDAFATCDW